MNKITIISLFLCFIVQASAECPSGQYFDLTLFRCNPCGIGCTSCVSSLICLNCNTFNYFLTSALVCQACATNCLICQQFTGACILCQTGQPNSFGICTQNPCPANCAVCSPTSCLRCNLGFTLSPLTSQCVACPSNCLQCNSNNQCLQCNPGSTLLNGVCSGSTAITSPCLAGFYLNSQNSCVQCPILPNCIQCLNNIFCVVCNQGFNPNSNGVCVALLCPTGFYINTNGGCTQCPTLLNCNQCLNNIDCKVCNQGFVVNSLGICIAFPQPPYACLVPGTNGFCLQCQSGFFLYNGLCLQPSSCNVGFYLDTSGTCFQCPALSNCISCLNSFTCLVCAIGFTPNSIGTCIQRIRCNNGFYLNTGGSCTQCPALSNCIQCLNNFQCDICAINYYPNSAGTCVFIQNPVSTFTSTSSITGQPTIPTSSITGQPTIPTSSGFSASATSESSSTSSILGTEIPATSTTGLTATSSLIGESTPIETLNQGTSTC